MSSRLTVGTERIPAKPPRGQPPCTEPPAETTANALIDPGFELQLANYGGGPDGLEIPHVSLGNGVPFQWTDGTDLGIRSHWAGNYITPTYSGTNRYWQLSTANPRTGIYHARIGLGASQPNSLWMLLNCSQYTQCNWVPPTASQPQDFYAASVQPGQFVRFGGWLSATTTADNPKLTLEIDGYTESFLGTDVTFSEYVEFPLTTSYAWYEISSFVPAGTVAVQALMFPECDQTFDDTFFDVDDFVLEVT